MKLTYEKATKVFEYWMKTNHIDLSMSKLEFLAGFNVWLKCNYVELIKGECNECPTKKTCLCQFE